MEIYVANLGEQNAHWPVCRSETVLTLETGVRLLDYWKKKDRDGWISWATENERMVNGQIATAAVASRWFNLITIPSPSQRATQPTHQPLDYQHGHRTLHSRLAMHGRSWPFSSGLEVRRIPCSPSQIAGMTS